MTHGQRLVATAVCFIIGTFLLWETYDSLPRVIRVSQEAIKFSSPVWGALKSDVKFYLGILAFGLGVFFIMGSSK